MIAEHHFDPERPQDPPGSLNGWPDAMIPFAFSPAQAEERFWLWRQARRFVPRSFRRKTLPVRIEPLYLPFWSFRAETRSTYEASQGTDRRVDHTYTRTDSEGNSETYTESSTTTDFTSLSGEYAHSFEAISISASKVLDRRLLGQIEDFEPSALVPWRPELTQDCVIPGSELSFVQGWAEGRAKIEQILK